MKAENAENAFKRRLLLAGAAGLVAGTALPGVAHAAPPGAEAVEPDIDSCATWGARAAAGTITTLQYRPSKIIVHHTVSPNTTNYSRSQAWAHSHWVQDLHMDQNGWVDTGYNFLVSRGGWITEGRHGSLRTLTGGSTFVQGAHTSGQNSSGIGIANEGTYHAGATPTAAQWDVLVTLCAYACVKYGIPASQIYGHMDFGDTECPGVIHDMLPQLRQQVAARM